jgi:holin-like protein
MLPQLALLMGFQAIGEVIVKVLGIPFPGPLCGMVLLLAFLHRRGGASEQLSTVSTALTDHLGLLFVPAGTAIITYSALLAREGVSILAALVLSTTVAVLIGGIIAERLGAGRRQFRDDDGGVTGA